jgi:hypothetical protein
MERPTPMMMEQDRMACAVLSLSSFIMIVIIIIVMIIIVILKLNNTVSSLQNQFINDVKGNHCFWM